MTWSSHVLEPGLFEGVRAPPEGGADLLPTYVTQDRVQRAGALKIDNR